MTDTTMITAAAILALAASCGGAETVPDESADQVEASDDTPKPWAEMSFDERKAFMALEVMPRVAPLFEAHDAERFSGFGCEGCHGEDAEANGYTMPNSGILTLHATGSQEQLDMINDMRPMVNFMFRDVVPTMKELLGADDYDTETGEGFGCFACHPNGGEGTPIEG